jgi:hypothetical protein
MGLQRNLDLDLLRTLCVVAEEGSFTRAAERVGRTQSAVSLQIQRLEGQTGTRGGAITSFPPRRRSLANGLRFMRGWP